MRDIEESSLARLTIPDVLTPGQYYGVRTQPPATALRAQKRAYSIAGPSAVELFRITTQQLRNSVTRCGRSVASSAGHSRGFAGTTQNLSGNSAERRGNPALRLTPRRVLVAVPRIPSRAFDLTRTTRKLSDVRTGQRAEFR